MKHQRLFGALCAAGLCIGGAACGSDTSSDASLPPLTNETGSVVPITPVSVSSGQTGDSTGSSTDGSMAIDDRLNQATDALQAGDFSTMLKLLDLSGLGSDIQDRAVTILAPSEGAFADLPSETVRNLVTNPTQIDDLLKRHVLDQVYSYDELAQQTQVTTLTGETLSVTTAADGTVMVEGATVSRPASEKASGDNGQELAVFGIDRVLLESS